MSELVIIGNGFDLHHGLNTSYGAFVGFAKQHSPGAYETLSDLFLTSHEYMGFDRPDPADKDDFVYDRWCDFETCLGILDDEEFGRRSLEDVSEYMEELGMEETLVNDFIENIAGILNVFRSWVSEIDLTNARRGNFNFSTASAFVNFNYTETLEALYGISPDKIFYIHGRRGTEDQLIVGHDTDPPQAKHKDDLPDIQYNPFYAYLRQTRKPVNIIEPKLQNWLDDTLNIEKISVRGHSLGFVDHPYFKAIAATYPSAEWSFSYYDEGGLGEIQNIIRALGIENERVSSVAKLTDFEVCPNTGKNALTAQYNLQNLFTDMDMK